MSLLCNANGERINFGSATELDDLSAFTVIMWVYVNTLSTYDYLGGKNSASNDQIRLQIADVSTNGQIAAQVGYTGVNCFYASDYVVPSGQWSYIAWAFDDGASANDFFRLYWGDLDTLATSRTITYNDDPTGSRNSDAAESWCVGDPLYSGVDPVDSNHALFALYDKRLSTEEIQKQQFCLAPVVALSNLVIFSELGLMGGTGTQPDLSGEDNTGSVSSATKADHVPLPAMLGFPWTPVPAPAAGSNIPLFMHHYKQLAGA
jgi:hypothetical protein